MRPLFVRLVPTLLAVALLLGGGWLFAGPASHNVSRVSAITAAPSPTPASFSELGSAVVVAPRDSRLPLSGSAEQESSAPWPKLAGAALALVGAALVYCSLRMRPQRPA
jgi:hypothetical protein